MCENDLLSCHIHTHIILAERETDLGNQRDNNNKKVHIVVILFASRRWREKKERQTRSEIIWKSRLRNRYVTSYNVGRKAKQKNI
jgi:hypothetical protein